MEKHSLTTALYRGGETHYLDSFWELRTWRPPCELPPLRAENSYFPGTILPPVDSLHNSVENAVSRIVGSNWIRYENSLWKKFNNCTHVRKSVSSTAGTIVFRQESESDTEFPERYHLCDVVGPNSGPHRIQSGIRKKLIVRLPQSVVGDLITAREDSYLVESEELFFEKLSVLDRIAMDTMIPQLDTGFSLPVFIFELGDVRKMLRSLNPGRWLNDLQSLAHKPLREISRHFLATVFGWLPFVSDVKTLIGKLVELRQNVARFITNADKRQTLHFQKGLSPYTFRDASWFSESTSSGFVIENGAGFLVDTGGEAINLNRLDYNRIQSHSIRNVVYHATMDFQYTIPDLGGLKHLLGAMDSFGLNLSPSDVWEIVPFSFLVDYFADVGGWLSKFDQQNLPARVEILDFCRSIKYLHTENDVFEPTALRVRSNVDSLSQWSCSQFSSQASVTSDCYFRWAGVPSPSPDYPFFRTPQGLQIVVIGALLGARS